MKSHTRLFTALPLAIAGAVFAGLDAVGQVITSEGWAEKSAGLEFYIEVPMVDNKSLKDYGVGRNITAESIINSVRYAGNNPKIHHVVFLMDTGGGALHHAEAMEDIIERHHRNTEYHIVVQNAISAGIWTAFSCDTIFMCRAGTIGGATAYFQLENGQVMSAGDIPRIAAELEITAERNGYPPQIIKPLMLMESELHYWTESDGKKVLSQSPPQNKGSVKNYKFLDRKDTVLTLTSDDAIEIGVAQPIDDFDASLVGEKLGVQGWTRANRYGKVIDQIGWIYNTTRVWEDQWVQTQLELERFPVTRQNKRSRAVKEMLETREKHAAVVSALRSINESLNKLPDVHPEKHIYIADGEKTLTANPTQWEEDAREARLLSAQLAGGLNQLARAFEALGVDRDNLEEIEEPIREIVTHVNGIGTRGNVAYWATAD